MVAASNTSPISNLAIIGQLDLLRSQFETIVIPVAVQEELRRLPLPDARSEIENAIEQRWIRQEAVRNDRMAAMLMLNLDAGEAEAIALAAELETDYLLIDERQGRLAARQAGVRVTGVLGVLIAAKRAGHIESLRHEIQRLRSEARFFIASDLENEVLRAVDE